MAWKLAEHVAFRRRNFGGFLVDIRDNSKKFLNETAADMVQLCDGSHSSGVIARQCAEKWNAPLERVSEDLSRLLAQLRELGFLERVSNGGLPVLGNGTAEEKAPILFDAQVHITKACSLRCTHCYNSSGEAMAGELSTEELLGFFDQLKELGAHQITVTGGEPLFHPDIWEILAHARRKFTVVLLTNGIHLNDEACARLKELKIQEIYISLDGATADTNDPIRGRNTFRHIVAGIERAVAHGLPVSLNMAITRVNHHQRDALIELAKRLGIKKVTMTPVVAEGRAQSRDDLFLDGDEIAEFKIWCYQKGRQEPDLILGELDPGGIPPAGLVARAQTPRRNNLCNAIRGSVTLLPNGDIIPCTLMERPELVTGNIRRESLRDIWVHSPLHKSLRMLSTDGCAVCSGCKIRDLCGGACRALTYIENGSFTGPPAREECNWRRSVFDQLAVEVGTDTEGLLNLLGLGVE